MSLTGKWWVLICSFLFIAGVSFYPRNHIQAASKNNTESSYPSKLKADYVAGEVLIRFKSDISEGEIKALLKQSNKDQRIIRLGMKGVDKINKSKIPGVYKLKLKNKKLFAIERLVEELKQDPDVASVSPNYFRQAFITPNDPLYSQQWHLNQSNNFDINAPEAWDIQTGSATIVTAVIDTGVYINHPDLRDSLYVNPGEDGLDGSGLNKRTNGIDDDQNGYVDDWQGWDTTTCNEYNLDTGECLQPKNSGNNPNDETMGHGTHVAGIIAATPNNQLGVAGVNWGTKILPIKVLNPQGFGTCEDVIAGMYYAAYLKANVVNLSLGGGSGSDPCDGEESAVNYMIQKGGVVVAAAGNDGSTYKSYPAGFDNVIAVGAVDTEGQHVNFSNYGSWVDIVSPGVNILSTMVPNLVLSTNCADTDGDGYAACSGTSMATPVVSGIVGLLLSQQSTLSAAEISNILANSATDIPPLGKDLLTSFGIVNAQKALIEMDTALPPIVQINSPNDGQPIGSSYSIIGYIDVSNFQSYAFNYASVSEPENWHNEGITLLNQNSNSNVGAQWDSSLVPAGKYLLRLTANTVDGRQYQTSIEVVIDHSIYGRWPARTNSDVMAIEDINQDDRKEIITQGESLIIYQPNGEISNHYFYAPRGYSTGPTLGNALVGNDQIEIGLRSFNSSGEFVSLVDKQGNLLPGWPTTAGDGATNYNSIITDINADGVDEVIYMECDINSNPWTTKLQVKKGDGTLLPGFENVIVDHDLGMCYDPSIPAVGNIDNDANKEIVTSFYDGSWPNGSEKIATFSHQGNKLWEYGIPFISGEEVYSPTIVLGDINGDSIYEILVLYGLDSNNGFFGQLKLIVLDSRGQPISPFTPLSVGINDLSAYLMLGDLNQDHKAEIFVNDDWWGAFAAFDGEGHALAGFPQKPEGWRCLMSTIVDLNHDGKSEFIARCKGDDKDSPEYGQYFVKVFNYNFQDGSLTPIDELSWYFGYKSKPLYPLMEDLDNDGKLEMVTFVEYSLNNYDRYLYAYKTNVTSGNFEWTGFFGNWARTSTYFPPILKKVDWFENGMIDFTDTREFLPSFNTGHCGSTGDTNFDCAVNIFDFNQILINLGQRY